MSSLLAGCRTAQRSTGAADQEDASYDDLVLRSLRTSNPSRLEKPQPSLSGKRKPSPIPFSIDLRQSCIGMPSFDDSTARSLAVLVLTGSALWLGARLSQKKEIKVRSFLAFGAFSERRNIRKGCLLFSEKEGDGRLRKGRSVGKGRASWVLSRRRVRSPLLPSRPARGTAYELQKDRLLQVPAFIQSPERRLLPPCRRADPSVSSNRLPLPLPSKNTPSPHHPTPPPRFKTGVSACRTARTADTNGSTSARRRRGSVGLRARRIGFGWG